MNVFRTVNLTFENMPTHELVSHSGEISLGRVLNSKYKRANSVRNQMGSISWNFLLTDGYRPSSGFHADLADGWLFTNDGNLFNSRMKSILGGSMKNVHEEIVTHCKINNNNITDRNSIQQFCPHILKKGEIAKGIFEKVEKKADDSFITRAVIEFFAMEESARKRLTNELENTQLDSLDLTELLKTLNIAHDLTKFLTRVYLKLDPTEKGVVQELMQSKSNWKKLLEVCGNHTTTITCDNPSKDFCEGNSVTKHFGLTVLFAIGLPGLIQGLSNVIFYKVPLYSLPFNFYTFQGKQFPIGFGYEIMPGWPKDASLRMLGQTIVVPIYLLGMMLVGPLLPMFRLVQP